MGIILETKSLTRRFDDQVAVDHIDFSINEGEVIGLVGLNGAGKTTLIKMLITLLPPSEGTATICGYDILQQSSTIRHLIGYVPQLVSADGDLTGQENLTVYSHLYDVPAAERKDRVQQALEFMDLSTVGEKLVREYSGGMVRRLEIAQSMLGGLCDRMMIMTHGKLVAIGTIDELKAKVSPQATLEDIFTHFAGDHEEDNGYKAASQSRRTAKRLG